MDKKEQLQLLAKCDNYLTYKTVEQLKGFSHRNFFYIFFYVIPLKSYAKKSFKADLHLSAFEATSDLFHKQ